MASNSEHCASDTVHTKMMEDVPVTFVVEGFDQLLVCHVSPKDPGKTLGLIKIFEISLQKVTDA